MKWHRINALLFRHLYLYQRSVPRLMDVLYWPVMALILWGFLSVYLEKINLSGVSVLTVLLGAIFLWELLDQSQRTVSIAFLEETWERNLLNIFVSPLRVSEFLASTAILGLVRIGLVGTVLGILSFVLYRFNIFEFGFYLAPFVLNLLFFGWCLGLFTTGIILRFGTSAQVLAFGFIFLIQPFSAVFYPVSALPDFFQKIAYLLPSTYVFEGMRAVISTGTLHVRDLMFSFAANLIYACLVLTFFYKMFARVKANGSLNRLD